MSTTKAIPAEGIHVVLGSGPVGYQTAKLLLQNGHRVRVVNRSGKIPGAGLSGAEAVKADATQEREVLRACEGASHIYHCANPVYYQWAQVHPPMQHTVIEAAIANNAALCASEPLYMYAKTTSPIRETSAIDPPSRKGKIRQQMHELLVNSEARSLKWVTVQASDYYGPGADIQSSFGTSRFFDPYFAGKPVNFLGNPRHLHSYTYLEDFARAMVMASHEPSAWGRAWIAPTVKATSSLELAHLFERELARQLAKRAQLVPKLRVSSFPKLAIRLGGLFDPVIREVYEMLYQWRQDFNVDSSDFENTFGIVPTPLAQGVAATVAAALAAREAHHV